MSEKKPVLDVLGIWEKIPHRFPFLLIDRIDELYVPENRALVGRKIVARKNVTVNEPYFTGHFPHVPVMPGVLQIESMAQAAAIAAVDEGQNLDVRIAKVDNARFRKPVVPGDVLEIHAEITKEKAGILVVNCQMKCDGDVVSEAEMVAKFFQREGAPS